ncbi:MAG: ATP-binding cassette domain-containing protein [Chlamydiae bacterium]|nr:ATP-binding cassette domain-containing protein [Chlamydiota bacterium]
MNKNFVLKAEKITKEFYHPEKIAVLKEISLEIKPNESVAITGVSGSGKSTLLQILATLEESTSGSIYFYGNLIRPSMISEIRNKKFGFVFQSSNLLEEESLLENVLLKAKIARRPTFKGSQAYEEALALINQVGLSHRVKFPVKYLSGGEKQRAAIARAFMNNPDLILADEPTGNLDKYSKEQVETILLTSCQKFNKSLIVVTHDNNFLKLVETKLQLEKGILLPCNSC